MWVGRRHSLAALPSSYPLPPLARQEILQLSSPKKNLVPKTTVINVYPLPVRVFLGIMKQIIQIKRNRVKKSSYWGETSCYLHAWPEI